MCDHFSVDSKGLAILINKKGFSILDEYVGYAALVMTWEHNPGSLYLYRGSSRDKASDIDLMPERPMYILDQTEGMYYSSIPESLMAISDDGTKPLRLIHNTVVEVVNGEFTDYRFVVNRENNNIKPEKVVTIVPVVPASKRTPIIMPESSLALTEDENDEDLIHYDSLPRESMTKNLV